MKETSELKLEEVVPDIQPPPRLFERLALIPGYTWDRNIRPFHSVS